MKVDKGFSNLVPDKKLPNKKLPNKKQLNNEGFSLVEVLVAMLILGIIIIPILNNLVLSSRINLWSLKSQRATTMAQNCMDGLKYVSIEEVAAQFNYDGNGKDFTIFDMYEVLNPANTVELIKEADGYQLAKRYEEIDEDEEAFDQVASCKKEADNVTYTFVPKSDQNYHFGMLDVSDGKDEYDVLISYDAKLYSSIPKEGEPTAEPGINDFDMPIITSIATDKNAVMTEGNRNSWAESTLLHNYNNWFSAYSMKAYEEESGLTIYENKMETASIGKNMRRQFDLYVTYVEGKYEVRGSLTYRIDRSIIDPSAVDLLAYYDAGNTFTPYVDNNVYYGKFDTLENIYLFFRPNLDQLEDTINLHNQITDPSKAEVCVCLVWEKPKDTSLPDEIASYRLNLTLNESVAPIVDGANTYFHTYLKMNVDETYEYTYDNFSDATKVLLDRIRQKEFIGLEVDKTRLYKKTIRIYEKQEAFEDKFKEENLLATFESSGGE